MNTRVSALSISVISVAAMACGGKSGGGSPSDAPAGDHDAPGSGPGGDAPAQHAFGVANYGNTPAFVEYHSASTGAWHIPTIAYTPSGESFVLDAADTDVLELVEVCVDSFGNTDLAQLDLVYPDDAQSASIQCYGVTTTTPPPVMVDVTGTMNQIGTLSLPYDTETSNGAPWSYDLQTPTGTWDLIAVGSDAVELDRGLVVAAATTGPTIDLATGGTPFDVVAATVTNLGSDALEADVYWYTQAGDADITSFTTSIDEPPAALIDSDDFTTLYVLASGGNYFREVQSDLTATSFALPDPLTGIAFATDGATTRATWSTLPLADFGQFALELYSQSNGVAQQATVIATSAWITATAATALAPDSSAPEFQPSWLPSIATAEEQQLEAVSSGTPTLITGVRK